MREQEKLQTSFPRAKKDSTDNLENLSESASAVDQNPWQYCFLALSAAYLPALAWGKLVWHSQCLSIKGSASVLSKAGTLHCTLAKINTVGLIRI